MRRTSVFVTIVFLAGLGIGFFARGAYTDMLQRRTHAADLSAIEKLHQEDIEVTLSQDPKGLADVWVEDGVRITPGNPPTVGKGAIAAENEKAHAEHPEFKVLKYAPDVKNFQIAIADGWAIVNCPLGALAHLWLGRAQRVFRCATPASQSCGTRKRSRHWSRCFQQTGPAPQVAAPEA